jgi:hypothetical protein
MYIFCESIKNGTKKTLTEIINNKKELTNKKKKEKKCEAITRRNENKSQFNT